MLDSNIFSDDLMNFRTYMSPFLVKILPPPNDDRLRQIDERLVHGAKLVNYKGFINERGIIKSLFSR